MAEREGFEPPIGFPLYTLSRRAPSTTRPSLRATDRRVVSGIRLQLVALETCRSQHWQLYSRTVPRAQHRLSILPNRTIGLCGTGILARRAEPGSAAHCELGEKQLSTVPLLHFPRLSRKNLCSISIDCPASTPDTTSILWFACG